MKTSFFGFFVATMATIMLFGGAAFAFCWEGAATIAPGGDLPGGGYTIATNSFPVNSVIDVKNLENDKVVRVNVVSGLNSAGLVATLSRDAAGAIGVHGDSSCRILMTEVSHEMDLSARLTLGPVIEPEPEPEADSPATLTGPVSEDEDAEETVLASEDTLETADTLAAAGTEEVLPETEVSSPGSPEGNTIAAVPTEETPAETPAAVQNPAGVITLTPSEERTPTAANRPITREYLAPPLRTYTPPASFSPFQAPLISSLEKGKSYVQIGAYARADNVEDEIVRAGKEYPVAIQNIGTDSKPLFRVLLGPLNRSESAVALQRAKNQGYKDAFVWHK